MSDAINASFNQESVIQLDRVNEDIVRETLKIMKFKKHDFMFYAVSDCFIQGPPELVFHRTNLVRLFSSHGSVLKFVILCTLIPLGKDNLGDITASSNYRVIAGGSLLLKLLFCSW